MAYVIIENNEVVFKSNKEYPNSIEVDDSVGTGMIRDKDGNFKYPPIPKEIKIRELRQMRDILLNESDWTQNKDVQLPNDEEWKIYRQELRDLPSKYLEKEDFDISNVSYPKKPELPNGN